MEVCKHQAEYDTSDGKRPRDRHPDVTLRIPAGLDSFILFLGIFIGCLVLAASGYLFWHRDSKLIKASQPPMLAMVLLGEAVAAVRVAIGAVEYGHDPWACHGNVWLGHLALWLVFGALIIKMWRVDKIINTRSLKRVKITNKDVTIIGLVAILLLCIYLACMSGAAGINIDLNITTVKNVDTYEYKCHEEIPEMEDALYGFEAFIMLVGLRLCNATKDAPSAVNESRPIALAASIIIGLAGIIMPVCYLLGLNAVIVEILASLGFAIGALASTALLIVPKCFFIWSGNDFDSRMEVRKQNQAQANEDMSVSISVSEAALLQAGAKALHGLDLDAKFGLCQRQIEHWRAMLVDVGERRSSGTNSGTNALTQAASIPYRSKAGKSESRLDSASVIPTDTDDAACAFTGTLAAMSDDGPV